MAKDKSTKRLWLRTDKITQDGKAPIFIIYSVKGQRAYYNSGRKVHPANWREETKQVVYTDKKSAMKLYPDEKKIALLSNSEVNTINDKLNQLIKKINELELRFKLDNIQYSSKVLIEKLSEEIKPETVKENPKLNIADWINWYTTQCTNTHKTGTIKCYTGLANHLIEFEKQSKQKVTFENIDLMMLGQFRDFLNFTKKQNNTTVAKQISTLRTLLDKAKIAYKIQINSSYKDFKNFQREDSDYEVIVLTDEEFEKMIKIDLSDNLRLDKQRDVFLFAAATGLRYSDLQDLKRVHIKEDSIKKMCIKTGKPLSIPLNPISIRILEKYKNDIQPLPIISNDKCRKYIKEVAEKCGIDEKIEQVRKYGKVEKAEITPKYELIGIHTGRKTFVTMMLNNGVPAQEVMAITDHKSYKSFQRYVDVSEKQKQIAMLKGFAKFQ